MPEFRRKPNRLPGGSYLGRGAYFVTVCVQDRKRVFADGGLVGAIFDALKKSCEAHSFRVYAYCFMLDHLHFILAGESDSSSLTELMRAFKGAATVAARKLGISELWQKGFYDHVLRSEKEVGAAAWYMFLNPV
jgi:putative transposase